MTERTVPPLPLELEAINRARQTAALRTRAPAVTVEATSVVDLNRGTCTKVRLQLQMDEAGRRAGIPQTVILKGGFGLLHLHCQRVVLSAGGNQHRLRGALQRGHDRP